MISKLLGKSSRKNKPSSTSAEDPADYTPSASASAPSSPRHRRTPSPSDKKHSRRGSTQVEPDKVQQKSPTSSSRGSQNPKFNSKIRSSASHAPDPFIPHSPTDPQPESVSPTRRSKHSSSSRPSSLRNPLNFEAFDQSPNKSSHSRNFPPDLRRHSTLPAMSTNDSTNGSHGDPMDISSPPDLNGPSTSIQQDSHQQQANSINDEPPVPPLHRIPTSPPVTPAVDPEAFKAAGNRFFKNQQYDRAIEEYSKGLCCL
jgi:DnaJ homolog subfamily C member 7